MNVTPYCDRSIFGTSSRRGRGRPPGPGQDTPYVDIYNEKPVRVATKVVVPTKQHPKVSKKRKIQLRKCCLKLICSR